MPKTIYRPEYRQLLAHLRERREAKGMTQAAAARALGWKQRKLSAAETGARRLDVIEFVTLARFLGLTPAKAFALAETRVRRVRSR